MGRVRPSSPRDRGVRRGGPLVATYKMDMIGFPAKFDQGTAPIRGLAAVVGVPILMADSGTMGEGWRFGRIAGALWWRPWWGRQIFCVFAGSLCQ